MMQEDDDYYSDIIDSVSFKENQGKHFAYVSLIYYVYIMYTLCIHYVYIMIYYVYIQRNMNWL